MPRPSSSLVIDARPRGPRGPLACERVLGRPILAHLIEVVDWVESEERPITVHARADEHDRLEMTLEPSATRVIFATGPPPEGSIILRTDRIYDPSRLRRALRKGRDPESAVIWRLDRPSALAGAEDELIRRTTYQPLGRFWALAPARLIARVLRPTRIRPNAVTVASALVFLGGVAAVAFAPQILAARLGIAAALAIALVLDTADGHLARLQGTASEFGRWLDANLDELNDMALHAAIAWSCFARDGRAPWLVLGMVYAIGKYLFFVGSATWEGRMPSGPAPVRAAPTNPMAGVVHWLGHADLRWHLWIALAALGRLDAALGLYAAYFPARVVVGAWRRAKGRA